MTFGSQMRDNAEASTGVCELLGGWAEFMLDARTHIVMARSILCERELKPFFHLPKYCVRVRGTVVPSLLILEDIPFCLPSFLQVSEHSWSPDRSIHGK
jgi:hypothetical protein